MYYDMGDVILCGNLTYTPELRFTSTGQPVTNVRVARNKGKNETEFYDVTIWDQMAENVAEGLKKGDRVIVIGSPFVNEWTDDNGITHRDFRFNARDMGASAFWNPVTSVRKNKRQGSDQNQPSPPSSQEELDLPEPNGDVPF